jgi:F-type H+-transporting ATPase subunit b
VIRKKTVTVASLYLAACETRRKLARLLLAVIVAAWVGTPAVAGAQPAEPSRDGVAPAATAPGTPATPAAAPAAERETVAPPAARPADEHEEHAPAEHAGAEHAGAEHGEGEEHHGRGIIDDIARLVNFAILVGTLVYLFGGQMRTYIADRGAQIRGDLVNAAETKKTAAAQIAEIEQKMRALPAELEALRTKGAQEIAAEEARINAAAAAERERLLEQARREIEMQTRIAERDLVAHAGNLAVGVAAERIKQSITDADQQRLIDQYVGQLKG